MDHYPVQLSGGEQQRVALARAFVVQPPVVMADEPTGNLDSVSANDIIGLLADLHRSGRTVVLITHDADVAEAGGRTMRIRDGQILEGEPAESGAVGR
jgi:putative ABC transport system ATP-binding protein